MSKRRRSRKRDASPAEAAARKHLGQVWREWRHATNKYPHFCDALLDYVTQTRAAKTLDAFRECRALEKRAGFNPANSILQCEMWEAFDAIAVEDWAGAYSELAQTAAVCVRMMEVVNKKWEAMKHGQ